MDIMAASSMSCHSPAWCLICFYMLKGSHHFLSLVGRRFWKGGFFAYDSAFSPFIEYVIHWLAKNKQANKKKHTKKDLMVSFVLGLKHNKACPRSLITESYPSPFGSQVIYQSNPISHHQMKSNDCTHCSLQFI